MAAIVVLLLGGCAETQKFSLRPNPHCYRSDLAGPLTLADTPDTAPFGADPYKTGCGAPPR
jgi:hypothetical protein